MGGGQEERLGVRDSGVKGWGGGVAVGKRLIFLVLGPKNRGWGVREFSLGL